MNYKEYLELTEPNEVTILNYADYLAELPTAEAAHNKFVEDWTSLLCLATEEITDSRLWALKNKIRFTEELESTISFSYLGTSSADLISKSLRAYDNVVIIRDYFDVLKIRRYSTTFAEDITLHCLSTKLNSMCLTILEDMKKTCSGYRADIKLFNDFIAYRDDIDFVSLK
ncbi:hypothetical protein [Enterococcus sp. BWR-S5]|uniref:hypothetical protein n=1 Tax=Enterococcus sp. BWR-S5 TaxID=2787714 RepID=UPI0019232EC7|nr:hypothetical protein [Enterococcus sp. BWR-S5]MBL1227239.1 hypothetical protein [Enterococcus sp. BWR-S5]